MMGDHDDPRIGRLWRGVSGETPGALLDARIMQAARAQRQRRRLVPWAAALAACLVLTLYVTLSLPPVPEAERRKRPPSPETSATAELSDPQRMHEMQLRQMPGGSEYTEISHSRGGL